MSEMGLGDIIKKMTSSVGIKPCGGCKKRAEKLNRYKVNFSPVEGLMNRLKNLAKPEGS